jgi:hypothetical protein
MPAPSPRPWEPEFIRLWQAEASVTASPVPLLVPLRRGGGSMIRLNVNGEPAWVDCPWCGATDMQPGGVGVQSCTGETLYEIALTDGQVHTAPRSAQKGESLVLVHFQCLQCEAIWEMEIRGGMGGTRLRLRRWEGVGHGAGD